MMRKFTFTLLMVLVFGSLSFGQYTYTASLQTLTASPNEDVSVNLSVTGFTGVGSFQFYIQVDPAVLTYQAVTNFTQPGLSAGTINGGSTVTLAWTNTTGVTWADGTLLTLKFKYNGLSSPVAFVPANCEVVKLVGVVPYIMTCTSFTDGAISPVLNNVQQATLGTVQGTTGSSVSVPLTYTGAAGTVAGAITQYVAYDPAVLTFINVTGSGLFPTFINASASNGVVNIAWANVGGVLLNTPGTQFNVNFMYNGSTTTPVTFSTGCVISTTAPVTNIPVTYNDGSVSLLTPPTSFASFPNITSAVQGQVVTVPLTLAGMPSTTTNFNLNLTYDNPRMTYVGYANAIQPVLVGSTGNTISITNANPLAPSPSINGTFMELLFMYNGVGTANINFASGCQFNNGSPIVVGYTNGSVSPAQATVNATLGNVSATSPATVPIPVTFTDIPSGTDIGAVTLNIGFDASKLTFVNATNPNGATVQAQGSVIHIAWSSTTPVIVNGTPFITLNFNYAAAGSSSTVVSFADGCQLANMVGTIVPANWNNGGINLSHSISGFLAYDKHPSPNLPLANATIYIKSGPEPIPPATAPVPAIIATTTTDGTGFFSVNVPNGTYFIYASTSDPWGGVDNGDVINIRRYAASLFPNTVDTPLRVRASDINQDGAVDNGDVIPLRRRIAGLLPNPGYVIADWSFDNPSVVVSGANVTVNLLGTCSGEVNGSYPN